MLDLHPGRALSPPQVVQAQLLALAKNGALGKNRGIEVVYRFASPSNRRMSGPLPRFSDMVRGGHGALLDHRRAVLGPLDLEATTAMQAVFVEDAAGTAHTYVFVLGLQDEGPLRGCWMTDAVLEVPSAKSPQ